MPNSVFYGGKFSVPNQAIGDLLVADTLQSWTGLADVAAGAILQSGGVGAAPAYTTKPNIVSTLNAATGNEVAFTLDYTVNKAAGNDTGLLINMIDTASPGTSLPFDIQVNGSSKFKMDNAGVVTLVGNFLGSGSIRAGSGSTDSIYWTNSTTLRTAGNGVLAISNAGPTAGVALDVATDSTLKVRNRANSADAALTAGAATFSALGAFAAGDKYVVADASGNLHLSALGPVS